MLGRFLMRSIEDIEEEIRFLRAAIREEQQFNEYGDLDELYANLDKLVEEMNDAKASISRSV